MIHKSLFASFKEDEFKKSAKGNSVNEVIKKSVFSI